MKQYNLIKGKYPGALLLFRVGDFYELFGEDAIKASNILDIVLTNRANGSSKIELAGFPHHSLDNYLPKLVRRGLRVAICDQLEDPKATKGIVKRGVTELITPGVSYNKNTIEGNKNNFLASISYNQNLIGIAFLDISTGEFFIAEGKTDYIDRLLQSLNPVEVILSKEKKQDFLNDFGNGFNVFALDNWIFNTDYTYELLNNQFQTNNLRGFGVEDLKEGIVSAGVILHYLKETHHNNNQHICSISRIEQDKYVWMDRFTIRNLELFHANNNEGKTLLDILDMTSSPMGHRLLKRWLSLPLKNKDLINDRHDIVNEMIDNEQVLDLLKGQIKKIGDLERLISRVATLRINPRECQKLKEALFAIDPIKEVTKNIKSKILKTKINKIDACLRIREKIQNDLCLDPPMLISKGGVINRGVDIELDKLREIKSSGKKYLENLLKNEISRTGISSLKISFNNVFGYYLEVRNTHKDKVPENWIRKQTLVSAERYITEELKEYESKILSADEKINILENQLYQDLVKAISSQINNIQLNAQHLSELDCLCSFALLANKNNYTRPVIDNSSDLIIKAGRHPVIEQQLEGEGFYVANDVYLDRSKQQIMMITGPNMSGKSALLRQTALIVLMAQIGSFVPASSANIGLVDKIFTRVGASDNISMGESTFMVEMNETSSILNNLSENSLILLDEIGRGTSTYDGISIAWAIAAYIHTHKTRAKTLFATHYHELNEMSKDFNRISNYNVSVKEDGKNIIFIRKIERGGSKHSFGIHVAKMAGMPNIIIEDANRMLLKLEGSRKNNSIQNNLKKDNMQLSFVKLDDPVLEQVRDTIIQIDINKLTPLEALTKLHDIKNILVKE